MIPAQAVEAAAVGWSKPFVGLTDEEAEKQDRDRLAIAMVECTTEYDWPDLPEWLKDKFRDVAREFTHWADNEYSPLEGQIVNEVEA